MPRYIAFLRGINVSGQKLIKMEVLKTYFQLPGFGNIVTYIQSGNVLFDTHDTDVNGLRSLIEKQLSAQLGYEVPVVLRNLDEMRVVIEKNPFMEQMDVPGKKLYVVFLSGVPDMGLHSSIDAYKNAQEELIILGSEVFILTDGIGNSKLTITLFEKKLGHTATMRNWATVNKVVGL